MDDKDIILGHMLSLVQGHYPNAHFTNIGYANDIPVTVIIIPRDDLTKYVLLSNGTIIVAFFRKKATDYIFPQWAKRIPLADPDSFNKMMGMLTETV